MWRAILLAAFRWIYRTLEDLWRRSTSSRPEGASGTTNHKPRTTDPPSRAPRSPRFFENIHKTAVHEAGHLIAAWYCTEVALVEYVTIAADKERLGHLRYQLTSHPRSHHCRAVSAMAGLAAELLIYRTMRAGPCRSDLLEARMDLREPWPWREDERRETRDQSTEGEKERRSEGEKTEREERSQKRLRRGLLPFEKIFVVPPSENEFETLSQAYGLAKRLLVHYHREHETVTMALLRETTLDTKQLERVLGKRGFLWRFWRRLLDPGFILPSDQREAA
jgi:hypothetical protein